MKSRRRDRVPSSFALRLVARDLKSGEIAVLVAALVVAVAAISAVVFFTDRVRQAMAGQAGESLAADLRLEADSPLPESLENRAADAGLAVADVVHFNTVVLAGNASALVDLRAVSAGYPLRGELRVADRLAGRPEAIDAVPMRGEVWAEPALLARLGLDVGDDISVGALTLHVARTLEFRPDEGWRLFELAPTLLVNLDDVAATGLLAPGSIAEYQMLFAGRPDDVLRLRSVLERGLEPGQRLSDARDGRPEVRRALDRAGQFLVLAAMVSVLLGGVAVAMAARRFVARRLDSIALMKCMGARHRDIVRILLLQLLVLVVIAATLGSLLGFGAQFGLTWLLADFVEAELPAPGLGGLWIGPLTALAVAVGFAGPPLAALGRVPPMRVLRQDLEPAPPGLVVVYAVSGGALGLLLLATFRDPELIAYVLAGGASTLALLYLAGRLLVACLGRLRSRVGVAWRYGIANVARRGRDSAIQVTAFGLGLMVLLLLGVLRTQLMAEWQDRLPETTANRFLINIQPGQPQAIADFFAARGMGPAEFVPLLRARISAIDGQAPDRYAALGRRARAELENDINLTWLENPGQDNRIVAGQWWSPGDDEAQLSIEQGMALRTGLKLGDEITFSIGGEELGVRVTSLRSVQWDSFRPNFFFVLNPGLAERYPHTYVSSLHVSPDDRAQMLELARRFPAVSAIDIGAVLEQVRSAMRRATMAVQYVFGFTLAAGIMVLLAAIQSTRDERIFESAVLRTLGARRTTVLKSLAAEFAALGLMAGGIAAGGAGGLAHLIATRVFDLAYVPGFGLIALGLAAGATIVGIAGTLAVFAVAGAPPVQSLQRV